MTAILAWVDGQAAYLLADTATSSSRPPPTILTASSLGQHQEGDVDREKRTPKFVVEDEQKVLRLSAHVMMAFTGNVSCASSFARSLRDELVRGTRLLDAIKNACAPTSDALSEFHAVIAANDSGKPEILVLESRTWTVSIPPPNETLLFGSGRSKPHYFERTAGLISHTAEEAPMARLVWALIELNTLALQEDLVSVLVGGAFVGGFVTSTEVAWQPTMYFQPYPPRGSGAALKDPGHRITTKVLDDRVIIRSTMASEGKTVTKLLRCCVVDALDWMRKNEGAVAAGGAWSADYFALIPMANGDRRIVLSSANVGEPSLAIFGEFHQWTVIRDDVLQWMGPETDGVGLWLPLPHSVSFFDPRMPGDTITGR